MSADQSIQSYFAGAAVDFRGNEGKIVVRSASAGGKAIIALAAAEDPLALGVVKAVGVGEVGQQVAVCVGGIATVRLGAAFTPGTDSGYFHADAAGLAIPAAAGDGPVGRLLFTEGVAAFASGDSALAYINPTNPES